tara:strand:- start:809 stop:1057 length:249 start_codon:yes stop_codon:yes gene_type:complete
MLLAIYYFFKGIKTMNNETEHFLLGSLRTYAAPENQNLVTKALNKVKWPRLKDFIRRTGFMPPELSNTLLKKFKVYEGNHGN